MEQDPTRLLLIEDEPADARLITLHLERDAPGAYVVDVVERLAHGLERLQQHAYDAVLLDLKLPDSSGLDSLARVADLETDLPIVVLTGLEDERSGEQMIRMGAQDYLPKDVVSDQPRALLRALRYAIVRHAELRSARQQRDWLEREVATLEEATGLPPAPMTARAFGDEPLRERAHDAFAEAVAAYARVLDQALEMRIYRVQHDTSTQLRTLADRLARFGAGPRDVAEIHTAALRARGADATSQRAEIYVSEGRLTALELMGYLVSVYRNYAVGPRRPRSPEHAGRREEAET